MMTQTQSIAPTVANDPVPYEGFEWSGVTQLCHALRDPQVSEALGMSELRFDQLAWAPRVGDRFVGPRDVEAVRERFASFAARHGQTKWRATHEEVRSAIGLVAAERPVHPIAERLSKLRWDGEARLARVATEVLGVDPQEAPHAAQVVRKWFLAAVARVFHPGCPADGVLTLVGEGFPSPGLFFRLLVPPDELADAPMACDSEEMAAALRSTWICAQHDLPLRATQDAAGTAAFLSRTTDEARAFGVVEGERAPRTTLFVAAVPAMPLLGDDALRRRFRLVPVGRLDAEKLQQWAESLWAEAATEYLAGASWRLTPAEETAEALTHRRQSVGDPWEPLIIGYMTRKLNDDDEIKSAPSLERILGDLFRIRPAEIDKSTEMRAAAILRRHGFRSRQIRVGFGRNWVWYPDWMEDDGTLDLPDVDLARTARTNTPPARKHGSK